MIRISSIVLNAGTWDIRVSGLVPADPNVKFYGGMAITQDPSSGPAGEGKTFKAFDGTTAMSKTNPFPWGLAIEPTQAAAQAWTSMPNQMGAGRDTLNYAWGGEYSAFHTPGNIADVSDGFEDKTPVTVNGDPQGASCPIELNNDWAGNVGGPFFADATGLLTVTAQTDFAATLGTIRAVSGSGPAIIVAVELNIQYWFNP